MLAKMLMQLYPGGVGLEKGDVYILAHPYFEFSRSDGSGETAHLREMDCDTPLKMRFRRNAWTSYMYGTMVIFG